MKSITLIGYMCVGKTTVGKALAKSLGCTFYDLDWYIEERFHSKVSQIFAEKGEEKFRDLEQRMLHEVAEFETSCSRVAAARPASSTTWTISIASPRPSI